MTTIRSHTWQDIQERIRANIRNRIWSPGDLIPGEIELAEQYGCARTTVNRALRELASTGVIDRKRKAGTRVALQKTRRVSAEIPIIRAQVEDQNRAYRFDILKKENVKPTHRIKQAMQIGPGCKVLHILSVHYADDTPYIYEDRWVNTQTISEINKVDLSKTSANEWLVQHVPFTSGEFFIAACKAGTAVAKALEINIDEPVLNSRRVTWLEDQSVTNVNLYYATGHQLRFEI
ncbi:MAG: UTRA domain-containing protein [Granulosicoccus sp.]